MRSGACAALFFRGGGGGLGAVPSEGPPLRPFRARSSKAVFCDLIFYQLARAEQSADDHANCEGLLQPGSPARAAARGGFDHVLFVHWGRGPALAGGGGPARDPHVRRRRGRPRGRELGCRVVVQIFMMKIRIPNKKHAALNPRKNHAALWSSLGRRVQLFFQILYFEFNF